MTRVNKLVGPNDTIDFLPPSPIGVAKDGYGDVRLDSSVLSARRGTGRVTESLTLMLQGADVTATAILLNRLSLLLRDAARFWDDPSQPTPVYWEQRAEGEAGSRFAVLYEAPDASIRNAAARIFQASSWIDKLPLTLIREHPWRTQVPTSLPSPLTLTKTSGTVDKPEIHVTSVEHNSPKTHLYTWDQSLNVFSANLNALTSIDLWKPGAPAPAVGDIVYVGWQTRPGFNIVLPIASIGDLVGTYAVKASYAGPVFTALTLGSQLTLYPDPGTDLANLFKTIGEWVINAQPGSLWVQTAINGVTAYWLAIEILTLTGGTTPPQTHATETTYVPRKPYFEISSARINGDASPRLMARFSAPVGGASVPGIGALSRIMVGARSNPPAGFFCTLHCHQYQPAGSSWTRTLGTDAAEETDTRCPEGTRLAVSFATQTGLVNRLTLTGTNLLSAYANVPSGSYAYRVLLMCEQVGGANGDLKVKARALLGSTAAGSPFFDVPAAARALKTHDAGYEAVDLGVLSVPFGPVVSADTLAMDLLFQIFAQRVAGAATLRVSRIRLLPVTEWYFFADDPVYDATGGASALRGNRSLCVDFGVLTDRTIQMLLSGASLIPSLIWHRSTAFSAIEPGKQYRFYCELLHYAAAFGAAPMVSTAGAHLAVSLYSSDSVQGLRSV